MNTMEDLISNQNNLLNSDVPPVTDMIFNKDHLSMPLAERRTCRPRMLPKRFRDDIPQPLAQLPPPLADLTNLPTETLSTCERIVSKDITTPSPTSPCKKPPIHLRITECFRTSRNAFGLLHQYFSSSPPSHDPEELVNFSDLCNGHGVSLNTTHFQPSSINVIDPFPSPSKSKMSFGPYPNESSFLLGDWYWNGGRQKSLKDFRFLLDIIGRPEFHPEDVCGTKWHAIDAKLG